MTTDIRPIAEEELEQAHLLLAYSFNSDRSEEGRLRHVESIGQLLGLYEEGELAACLRILPLRMFVHGASIPLGGVSSVACLPEHRRKGYVGQLLRHALGVMREQGQPISTLYTPHPSLYRRYGWMFAASTLRYRFDPKEIAPVSDAPPRGRASRASEEDWPALAEVYRRFAAPRNGYMDREERWWREAVFRELYDHKRKLRDVAVWAGENGEPRGYIVYGTAVEHRVDAPPFTRFVIWELIALDGTAYQGLLRYVLSHDLTGEVTWWGPPEDPFVLAVDEPQRVKREQWGDFMLRIVDVGRAIAARPPAAGAPEGAFTIQIADASAPWNQGAWRIESAGGRLAATKADGTADLATDAATFAAMYNGFLRPSEAARAGLAEVNDPQDAALADGILAADYPPFDVGFF